MTGDVFAVGCAKHSCITCKDRVTSLLNLFDTMRESGRVEGLKEAIDVCDSQYIRRGVLANSLDCKNAIRDKLKKV